MGICRLEEARSKLYQPLWINSTNLPHVLFTGQDKLKIHNPVRLSLEERRRRVDKDRILLYHSFVTFLWIFTGCMEEEARTDCFPDFVKVAASADKVQLVAVHDLQQLLAHILCTL